MSGKPSRVRIARKHANVNKGAKRGISISQIGHSHINSRNIKLLAYVICGFMAALTGLFVVARTQVGDPMIGEDFTLSSIAAVVIGGTSLFGGIGNLGGTTAGILIMALLGNTMNLNSVSGYTQLMVRGVIIMLVVSLYRKK